MTAPIVIAGGGLAAGTAVTELRELGYDGELVVVAEESHPPYERPPLSTELLQGRKDAEATYVHPAEWYDEHEVDLRTGVRVSAVDPDDHSVQLDGGERLEYSTLLLATGARARRLELEPTNDVAVRYLRTLDDAVELRGALGDGRRLLVVGGGWIGMEVAASARQLGSTVTLVEPEEQPLLAALGPDIGSRFATEHRAHGVDLRTSTGFDHLDGGEAVLSDGSRVQVDTVLVGIGAVPNDELARDAGLAVDGGILVDAGLRTDHDAIFAAGDVAKVAHPVLGERVRVEHWQNAIDQGKVAARVLIGEDVEFSALPYFFTDQYDLGMEYFGHVGRHGFDRLDVEDGERGSYACFWWRGRQLVAAMHVNEWDRSDELRARVREGTRPRVAH
ncbi:MAG TPA: FAD-dependent oxidoreductase [Marmoricola sp.]|nr:FAD-dependent oxidoreductase [Marmoricola sp.]